jgi:hypothetical protein
VNLRGEGRGEQRGWGKFNIVNLLSPLCWCEITPSTSGRTIVFDSSQDWVTNSRIDGRGGRSVGGVNQKQQTTIQSK